MRILVCPHQSGMGGSQLNAIELAMAMRRYGHDPVVFAAPGLLTGLLRSVDLEWVEAPAPEAPALAWSRKMAETVRRHGIELIHAYEWRPCLQAAFGSGRRIPLLMSVMSMEIPRFLPTHVPIVVGTPELQQRMRDQGRTSYLVEPPVDMTRYRSTDVPAARRRWDIPDETLVISVVSMLTTALEKVQGVLEAIRVVDRMAAARPVRLLIAGDGEGREAVEKRAAAVNHRHGRTVVHALGFQLDSSPVYEAADVVLGMGSSALKGLAHAKPLVVHGEAGFWRLLTEESAPEFLHGGWYGRGGAGAGDLARAVDQLVESAELRARLGSFGRELVVGRYGLDTAADRLAAIYEDTAHSAGDRSTMVRSLVRSAAGSARYYTSMRFGSVVAREQWAREGAIA
ncbi:glycosyltransferase family 4 protein [Citricoccus sp. GCM10030269]|uniref:glycosyltransferase family 4 protein n=1 Tax=Citricoccus sp. GCM10030269 TaxID=3273388 RepID=UPI003622988D